MVQIPISPKAMVIISSVVFVIGVLLIMLEAYVGILLLFFGLGNSLINIPGFIKQLSSERDVRNVKGDISRALRTFDEGNYQGTLSILNNLLGSPLLSSEGKTLAKVLRARCYFQLKQFDNAYNEIKQVFSPTSRKNLEVEDFILKFLCEFQLGMPKQALQTVNEALECFPNNPKLLTLLQQSGV